MKFLRKSIPVLLAAALLIGLAVPVMASPASRNATLEVLYRNIQIMLNGETLIPRDEQGRIVEPFIYQGTTFLPVRAVADALGIDVDWDDASATVLLEQPQRQDVAVWIPRNQLPFTPTPPDLRPIEEMEPVPSGLAGFQPSTELPETGRVVRLVDRPNVYLPDVWEFYVQYDSENPDIYFHFIAPRQPNPAEPVDWPLIIYSPGAAWGRQNLYVRFNWAIRLVERGFAVAVVRYRDTALPQRDAFPAPVEDLRTAVRYLRQNAEHFSVDTDRFVMWGDSSGGHISAMAAITGDGMFDNGRLNQYSSDVAALITWYPPSYLPAGAFYPSLLDRLGPETSSGLIIGGVPLLENLDLAREASTTTYIPDAENIPPTLIITGNNDIILPYNQSVRFYEALRQYGHTAEFVMVLNGNHGFEGAGFFSDAIFDIMEDFIREHVD